jgi:phage-related protein
VAKVGDAYIEIKPDLDKFSTQLRMQMRQASGSADQGGRDLGRKVSLGFGSAFTSGIAATLGKQTALWGTLATFAGPLVSLTKGLAAATTALASSMGAAAVAGAGLVPIYGAIKQATLVTKLAMLGMEDAFSAYADVQDTIASGAEPTAEQLQKLRAAMQQLAPQARQVVRTLYDLRERFKNLARSVQSKMFDGIAGAMRSLTNTYMPVLRKELGATATVLNEIALDFAGWAKSTTTIKRVGAVLRGNTQILRTLGAAVRPVGDSLLILYRALLPLGNRLAKGFVNLSRTFASFLDRSKRSGELTAFFNKAWRSARLLWDIASALGRALRRVFVAGIGPGNKILRVIRTSAEAFARWTNTVEGRNAIRAWFREGVQVFKQLWGLLGDLGRLFGKLNQTADASNIVKQLRRVLKPVGQLLVQLNKQGTGQQLLKTLGALARLLVSITAGGALVAFLNTMTSIVRTVTTLAQKVPGLTRVLSTLAVAYGTLKAATLAWRAAAFAGGGIVSMIGTLKKVCQTIMLNVAALRFVAAAQNQSTAAVVRSMVAEKAKLVLDKVIAVATKAWAAAQWLLNVAMTANPIGLIVAAIVGLVAIVVVAYKKFGWFRKLVATVWKGIQAGVKGVVGFVKRNWKNILAILTGPIGIAVRIITANWDKIVRTAKALWRGLVKIWHAITGAISGAAKAIWKNVVSRFNNTKARVVGIAKAIWTFLKKVWHAIQDVVVGVASAIVREVVSRFNTTKDRVVGVAKAIWSFLTKAWKAIQRVVVGAATAIWRELVSRFNATKDRVVGAAKAIWNGVKAAFNAVKNAVLGLGRSIGGAISTVQNAARNIRQNVIDALSSLIGKAVGIGKDIINGLINGIKAIGGKVLDVLKGIVGGAIDGVKGMLGIGSPSKVMAEIGKDTVRGFTQGIEEATGKELYKTYKKLADAIYKETEKVQKAARLSDSDRRKINTRYWKLDARLSHENSRRERRDIRQRMRRLSHFYWSGYRLTRKAQKELWNNHDRAQRALAATYETLVGKQQHLQRVNRALSDATERLKGLGEARAELASGVRDAVLTTRDLFGSLMEGVASDPGAITERLERAWRIAYDFQKRLQGLIQKGFSPQVIAQIASQGPEAGLRMAEVLVQSTKEQVSRINTAYKGIGDVAAYTGEMVAGDMYDAGIKAAQGLVNGLKSQQRRLREVIDNITDRMVRRLKRNLRIGSPSKVFMVFGHETGAGLAKGILDKATAVQQAADRLTPVPQSPVPQRRLAMPRAAVARGLPEAGAGEGKTELRVFIGEKELTDIVRAQIVAANRTTTKRLVRGQRAAF